MTDNSDGRAVTTEALLLRPWPLAARMARPTVSAGLRGVAVRNGVCIRPLALRRTELATGHTAVIDLRCGSTQEKVGPSCATPGQAAAPGAMPGRVAPHHRADRAGHRQVRPEGLIRLRANYEYARNQCLQLGEWEQVLDLDEATHEVEVLIAASRLRGAVTPGNQDGDNDEKAPASRRRGGCRRIPNHLHRPQNPRRRIG